MKIGIDIQSTLKKPTGIGQYTLGLVKGLADLDKKNEYYLYCRKSLLSRHKRIPALKYPNFKIINDIFNKGLSKALSEIDLFFSPTVEFLDPGDIPLVVTIHDLRFKVYPQFYNSSFCEFQDKKIKKALERANQIICVSNNTRNDLLKFYGRYAKAQESRVVYPSIDEHVFNKYKQSKDDKVFKKHGIDKPYFLSVATLSRMKNTVSVLKAFSIFKKAKLPHILVLAGSISKDYTKEELLEEFSLDKNEVIFTGYETKSNLVNLYKNAELFIFSSLYEGFGIPILEAIFCGTPVITSKTSACKEVAEDAAITVSPHNIEEIAETMRAMATNVGLKKEYSRKGLKRFEQFRQFKSANKMLNILNEFEIST